MEISVQAFKEAAYESVSDCWKNVKKMDLAHKVYLAAKLAFQAIAVWFTSGPILAGVSVLISSICLIRGKQATRSDKIPVREVNDPKEINAIDYLEKNAGDDQLIEIFWYTPEEKQANAGASHAKSAANDTSQKGTAEEFDLQKSSKTEAPAVNSPPAISMDGVVEQLGTLKANLQDGAQDTVKHITHQFKGNYRKLSSRLTSKLAEVTIANFVVLTLLGTFKSGAIAAGSIFASLLIGEQPDKSDPMPKDVALTLLKRTNPKAIVRILIHEPGAQVGELQSTLGQNSAPPEERAPEEKTRWCTIC